MAAGEVSVERGVRYGGGKLLDVYRPAQQTSGARPTVLLWHGIGPDERDVLEPLAREIAGSHGMPVVAPDWRSDGPDGGREHLLTSLAYTRAAASSLGGLGDNAIVLAGWSRGGKCAAAIAVRPAAVDGWRPMAVVSLGSGYTSESPFGVPAEDLARCDAEPVPFWLVHGTEDPVVPVAQSRDWASLLTARGWPVRLAEQRTDHAGVIGTQYDERLRRCVPSTAGDAVTARQLSARLIAEAAKAGPPTR